MKKLLYTIIALIAFFIAGPVYAYDCVAQSGGVDLNFSTAGNWTGCNSTYPQGGDNIDFASIAIVWDIATIPASGTLGTVTASGTGTGGLTLDFTAAGPCEATSNCALNATTIQAGYKTANAGMIAMTGAGAGHTVTIVGNITGGGNTGSAGVSLASSGTLAITGSVTGGAANTAHGVVNALTGAVTISGNATGGGGLGTTGVTNSSTGTLSVGGNITAGTGSKSYGVLNDSTGVVTLNAASNLINTAAAVAYGGRPPIWPATAKNYMAWDIGADAVGAPNAYFSAGLASDSAGTPITAANTAANVKAGTYFVKKDDGVTTIGTASGGGGGGGIY